MFHNNPLVINPSPCQNHYSAVPAQNLRFFARGLRPMFVRICTKNNASIFLYSCSLTHSSLPFRTLYHYIVELKSLISILQTYFVGNERYKLRIGRFSFPGVDSIAKHGIQWLHLASVPRHFNRMPYGTLHSAGCSLKLFCNCRIQYLSNRIEHFHILS